MPTNRSRLSVVRTQAAAARRLPAAARRLPAAARRLAAAALIAALPLTAALPATAAPTTYAGYRQVVDITFPLRKGVATYSDTYWAARSGGRTHQATDLMARKMRKVFAAKGGTVCYMTGVGEKPPSYGMMIVICGTDGRRYSYLHLNNDTPGTDNGRSLLRYAYAPNVRPGAVVKRGQFIGYVGDSGNAETTAPHLHFEISQPTLSDRRIRKPGLDPTRINPWRSLYRAERQGDYPGVLYPPT